jgi:hypothetical protein
MPRLSVLFTVALPLTEFAAGFDQYAELRAGLAARFPAVLGYTGKAAAEESPREGPRLPKFLAAGNR